MLDSKIKDCRIIKLPKNSNRAGNLTSIHNDIDLPFVIKRVFYLYDIPGGESRGAHAHKECHQFLIAASGSFDVVCDDGMEKAKFYLNRPDFGLYIPPGIWAHEENFSSGAICLVLASECYKEYDYLRSYQEYLKLKRHSDEANY